LIELLISVIGLLFLVILLVGCIVIFLGFLKWIVLWATTAKDL
jgi:hypothetical protein